MGPAWLIFPLVSAGYAVFALVLPEERSTYGLRIGVCAAAAGALATHLFWKVRALIGWERATWARGMVRGAVIFLSARIFLLVLFSTAQCLAYRGQEGISLFLALGSYARRLFYSVQATPSLHLAGLGLFILAGWIAARLQD